MLTYRRPRYARLRQPRDDWPRPLVRIVTRFRWAGITVARVAWPDGYINEVEASLLAPA